MDELEPAGPVDARLGRWLLDRLVTTAVRYGHPFAIALARTPDRDGSTASFAELLRGADVIVHWADGEILLLLPDTGDDGAARALARLRAAAPEAQVSAVAWRGDLAQDLHERLAAGLGAVSPR
jgi:hypothetical protein